jgi:hypothetical protein
MTALLLRLGIADGSHVSEDRELPEFCIGIHVTSEITALGISGKYLNVIVIWARMITSATAKSPGRITL